MFAACWQTVGWRIPDWLLLFLAIVGQERPADPDRRLRAFARLAHARAHRELGLPRILPGAWHALPIVSFPFAPRIQALKGQAEMSAVAVVESVGERRVPTTEQSDRWWSPALLSVLMLTSFSIYALWAALQNANYYVDPYLSPFYSPCLAQNCLHASLPIIGSWWNLSLAFLVLGIPLGRATCYYYRRAWPLVLLVAPCMRDAGRAAALSRRDDLSVSDPEHPPLLLLPGDTGTIAVPVVGRIAMFRFPNGVRHRPGHAHSGCQWRCCRCTRSLVPLVPSPVRWLSRFVCSQSCRQLWGYLTRLNTRHGLYAWISLFSVIHGRPVRAVGGHGRDYVQFADGGRRQPAA